MRIDLKQDEPEDDAEIRTVSGIKVRIEYPEGSIRKGVGANGVPWQTLMSGASYGEIPGTEGADGEAIDCYVGPFGDSREAYVLEQLDFYGRFDEYKIFLGFFSLEHAQTTYARLANADNAGSWTVVPSELIAGLVRIQKQVPKIEAPVADAQPGAMPQLPTPQPISVEASDEPTNEEATVLADEMTELQIDRCEHNRVNECPKCGVERVRGVLRDDAGAVLRDELGNVRWKIAWRALKQRSAQA
jgi:hypothetical protein